jgi:hypothetical protein
MVKWPRVVCSDVVNVTKYGLMAPLYAERIWIDPLQCKFRIKGYPGESGSVIESTWPPHKENEITLLEEHKLFEYCVEHWVNGVPWHNVGVYENMEKLIFERGTLDGCKNIDDIVNRYRKLDEVFEEVRKDNRIKTRKELNSKNFREEGGIRINIGPLGELVFGPGGQHRLYIAIILGLRLIPSMLGCVHVDSINYLSELRRS